MHISLDSALGRQRRLNQIGETINSIAAPTAAYSLRSLTGGDPLAVRVRRQGTGEEDFTVSQINSGALVDYVNTNGVFANTGYESFSNASTGGFTASNTGSTGFAVSDLPDGTSGTAISVSFDISITNGSPSISLRTALNGGSSASNSVNYTSSGSKTATLTATGNYVGVGFSEGDAPSNFTVSNFKILGKGFVSIWYDQSGNANNAPQTTEGEQPIIVNNGSLVSNGIDFDVTNDTLDMPTNLISSTNSASGFVVAKSSTTSGSRTGLALSRNSPDFRFYIPILVSSNFNFGYQDSATKISLGSADTDKHLFTAIAGSSNAETFLDGTSKGTTSSADGKSALTSGGIGSINSTTFWDGQIEEIIIYNSDQTANRTKLETNIMNHYSIS